MSIDREIKFILTMQNDAKAAIKSLVDDMATLQAAINGVSEAKKTAASSGSSGGGSMAASVTEAAVTFQKTVGSSAVEFANTVAETAREFLQTGTKVSELLGESSRAAATTIMRGAEEAAFSLERGGVAAAMAIRGSAAGIGEHIRDAVLAATSMQEAGARGAAGVELAAGRQSASMAIGAAGEAGGETIGAARNSGSITISAASEAASATVAAARESESIAAAAQAARNAVRRQRAAETRDRNAPGKAFDKAIVANASQASPMETWRSMEGNLRDMLARSISQAEVQARWDASAQIRAQAGIRGSLTDWQNRQQNGITNTLNYSSPFSGGGQLDSFGNPIRFQRQQEQQQQARSATPFDLDATLSAFRGARGPDELAKFFEQVALTREQLAMMAKELGLSTTTRDLKADIASRVQGKLNESYSEPIAENVQPGAKSDAWDESMRAMQTLREESEARIAEKWIEAVLESQSLRQESETEIARIMRESMTTRVAAEAQASTPRQQSAGAAEVSAARAAGLQIKAASEAAAIALEAEAKRDWMQLDSISKASALEESTKQASLANFTRVLGQNTADHVKATGQAAAQMVSAQGGADAAMTTATARAAGMWTTASATAAATTATGTANASSIMQRSAATIANDAMLVQQRITAIQQSTAASINNENLLTAAKIAAIQARGQGGGGGPFGGLVGQHSPAGQMLNGASMLAGPEAMMAASMGPYGAAVYAVGTAFKYAVSHGDQMRQSTIYLNSTLNMGQEIADSYYAKLQLGAQQSGLKVDELTKTFVRFNTAAKGLGVSASETMEFTKTLEKLAATSGADPYRVQMSFLQLSEGMDIGRLNGQHLRGMESDFPQMAEKIAANLQMPDGTIGTTIGMLRQMGTEGELTAKRIFDAIMRAGPEIAAGFANMPMTMSRGWEQATSAIARYLAEVDKTWSVSKFIGELLSGAGAYVEDKVQMSATATPEDTLAAATRHIEELIANRAKLMNTAGKDSWDNSSGDEAIRQLNVQIDGWLRLSVIKRQQKAADDARVAEEAKQQGAKGDNTRFTNAMEEADKFLNGEKAEKVLANIKELHGALQKGEEFLHQFGITGDDVQHTLGRLAEQTDNFSKAIGHLTEQLTLAQLANLGAGAVASFQALRSTGLVDNKGIPIVARTPLPAKQENGQPWSDEQIAAHRLADDKAHAEQVVDALALQSGIDHEAIIKQQEVAELRLAAARGKSNKALEEKTLFEQAANKVIRDNFIPKYGKDGALLPGQHAPTYAEALATPGYDKDQLKLAKTEGDLAFTRVANTDHSGAKVQKVEDQAINKALEAHKAYIAYMDEGTRASALAKISQDAYGKALAAVGDHATTAAGVAAVLSKAEIEEATWKGKLYDAKATNELKGEIADNLADANAIGMTTAQLKRQSEVRKDLKAYQSGHPLATKEEVVAHVGLKNEALDSHGAAEFAAWLTTQNEDYAEQIVLLGMVGDKAERLKAIHVAEKEAERNGVKMTDQQRATVLQNYDRFNDARSAMGRDPAAGMMGGIEQLKNQYDDVYGSIKSLTVSTFNGMSDAIAKFATTGKFNFHSFAQSVIEDMIRIAVQQAILRPLMGMAMSAFGGAIGGGGGLADVGANLTSMGHGGFHSGGFAGDSTAFQRTVADSTFAGAKRYHSGGIAGLGDNEVPAILKKGEAILPTHRMGDGTLGIRASGMGSGHMVYAPTTNITVNAQGGTERDNHAALASELSGQLNQALEARMSEFAYQSNRPGGRFNPQGGT